MVVVLVVDSCYLAVSGSVRAKIQYMEDKS